VVGVGADGKHAAVYHRRCGCSHICKRVGTINILLVGVAWLVCGEVHVL
jgi:hypothetical protein